MTEHEEVLRLRRENGDLAHECARLRLRLCDMQQECRELEEVNAELCVELVAGDYVIGEAMDELLGRRR